MKSEADPKQDGIRRTTGYLQAVGDLGPQGLQWDEAAPAGQAAAPKRQYFYRDTACEARSSEDFDCTCWHDEGTGPLANEPDLITSWREKKAPATEAMPLGVDAALAAAQGLVQACQAAGLVLTIEQVPLQPLAMGHYRTACSVRQARGGSTS